VRTLSAKPLATRAVMQVLDPAELLVHDDLDYACTLAFQFLAREGYLHCFVFMRANDAFLGAAKKPLLLSLELTSGRGRGRASTAKVEEAGSKPVSRSVTPFLIPVTRSKLGRLTPLQHPTASGRSSDWPSSDDHSAMGVAARGIVR
jgi:hypothetical protein